MLRRTYVEPKGKASIQTDYEYDAVSGKETKVTLFDYPHICTENSTQQQCTTSTQKSYYDNGNLKSEKDELNVTVNYEYHPNNMLKSVTHVQDGKNLLTEYRLSDPNSANPVTETIISPRGRQTGKQTQQKYEKGRLIEVIDPEGNRVSYTYDAVGNKKQEIHYDKNSVEVSRVSYDYDNLGRVVSTTDAEGKVIYTQWSIHGEERILTDANSRQTVFEYDGNGNVKSKKDTLNNVTQFEYDENDHLIMETDAENRKRHYLYNDKGLLVTEFRHGNSRFTDAIVSYEYDVFGHVNKVYKHRNGAFNDKVLLEEYEYDKRGHKTKITSYQGDKARTTKYDLSVKGQVLFFTDPKANKTGFNYYDSGEIKSVTDAENGIAGQQFDADGNRIALTDPKQNTTTFDHDANKKQTLENPQGGVKPFTREYNALGLLAKRTNGREQAESYTYYKNGWLRTVTVDGKIYTYTYDNNGNVLRVDGSDNSAIVRTCHVPWDHIPSRSYPLFKARAILEGILSTHGYKAKRT